MSHLPHSPPELQEGVAEGVAVAGPLRVVELDHLPLLPVLPQPDRPDHKHLIARVAVILCYTLHKDCPQLSYC